MSTRLITRILNLAVGAALLLIFGASTTAAKTSAPLAAAPPHPAAPADAGGADWNMHFQNPQRTSYEPNEGGITLNNWKSLTPLWTSDALPNTGGVAASSPMVYQSSATSPRTVYLGGPANSSLAPVPNFFAFNATTGSLRWQTNLGSHTSGLCSPVGLGVASTAAAQNGIIVTGGADSRYYAFDVNGSGLWKQPLTDDPTSYAWSSPLIYTPCNTCPARTSVGVAAACDPPYVQGAENAYDLNGGRPKATFTVVPLPYVGGSVWQDAAVSSDGKYVLVTTGNDPSPTPSPPPAPNYTRSIVVLDANTFAVKDSKRPGADGVDQDWASGPTVFHNSHGETLVGAQLKAGQDGGYHVYTLDPTTGALTEKSWSPLNFIGEATGVNAAYDPTPSAVYPGGILYIPSNGPCTQGGAACVYALDPESGHWVEQDLPQHYGNGCCGIWGQMALANGFLFVNDGGFLDVYTTGFADQREFKPDCATCIGPGANFSGVTVSHGIVYWVYGGLYGDFPDAYVTAWKPILPP